MQTRAINWLGLKSHLIASSGMWEAQELCVWDSWLVAEKETLNFTECCWDTCIHTEDN